MRLSRFRFYIAIFALLAFTSQSFAVEEWPCQKMSHEPDAPVMSGTMALGSHTQASHTQADNALTAAAADCCSQDHCSQMDCISASVAVVSTLSPFPVQFSQTFNTAYSVSFLSQEASSLFRPPISR
tara:strand:+ start:2948 stop:3328 length:381 start_codon:yes stop_codon:yes gene_type:complete